MHGLSGLDTARRIRAQAKNASIPIIFLTAYDIDAREQDQAYALGAVDFLSKPLVGSIVRAKVTSLVQLFKEKEQARRQAEQYRLLVEGTRDYAILMLDTQGRIVSWNPGAQRIKGWTAEEIIGQHFSRFYPREAVERGWPDEELRRAAAEGRIEDEGWRVRKDGSMFWANVVITALRDENGILRGFGKVTRDMTERKQAEENTRRLLQEETSRKAAEASARDAEEARKNERRQREQLHVTLSSIGDAVIVTDPGGVVTFMNPVAEELTGWEPEMAAGQPLERIFHIVNEHTRQRVENPVSKVLREGAVVGLANHTILLPRHGQEIPIDDSGAPIRGADGTIAGVVLVFRDITARKRHEVALRFLAGASKLLSQLLDIPSTLQKVAGLAVPQFADWCAVDMLVPDGSLRRLAVAHVDPSKLSLAQALHQRFPPDPNAPQGAWNILRTGKSELVPEISDALLAERVKDPELLRIIRQLGLRSYMGVPLVGRGKVEGVLTFVSAESGRRYDAHDLAMAEDLAHRAAIAIENARLYSEVRETDRRKDEFLAMLAHELRNPLAPIRSSLQILKMPRVDPVTAERTREMMERQVHHLVRLVDDLLDVSRVMRGNVELRKQQVELATVIAGAVESTQALVEALGHELTIQLPTESLTVEADPIRLTQVFGNLLTNAAKYTDSNGRIALTAQREGDQAVVRLRDTGIGIAPDMLPRIFDLFVQAEHASTRTHGGLGIGLTLVKNLVEMHGGTIEAHSAGLGKGSEFVVRLPLLGKDEGGRMRDESAEGAGAVHPSSFIPHPSGRRVLVVDDNVDVADSLAVLLRLQGHDVRVAHDGPTALQIAKEYRPELVFLDIGMPVMDGYEVARRMRQEPGLEKVRLAALTGWGQQEDRRRTAEAGFDLHLVKPVEPRVLEELLAEIHTTGS
jgi:PAS domain S-box-containing protein